MITIREETAADYRAVEELTREAFWNVYRPGCTEHFVLHKYRDDEAFVKPLSLVLEEDGRMVGHVMFSQAEVRCADGRLLPIMPFGPISIHPDCQRRGYGLKLLSHALAKARTLGCKGVCMEGNIDFYKHAGFVVASTLAYITMICLTARKSRFFWRRSLSRAILLEATVSICRPRATLLPKSIQTSLQYMNQLFRGERNCDYPPSCSKNRC